MSTAQTEDHSVPAESPAEVSAETQALPPGAIGFSDLRDEQGLIPDFGPAKLDADGRIIHPTGAHAEAWRDAMRRASKVMANDNQSYNEPPGMDEIIMRALDEGRPPGEKLFEGYY